MAKTKTEYKNFVINDIAIINGGIGTGNDKRNGKYKDRIEKPCDQ